ncbi:MAG: VOC family protein [Firmicutes bacterium]|nr:VOC family protein [Bacillota bacterium]
MKNKIATFLTFNGKAEEAMNHYAKVLPGAKIVELVRYGTTHPHAEPGEENKILHGQVVVGGETIMFLDMPTKYPSPKFEWSSSICFDCKDRAEYDQFMKGMPEGGSIMTQQDDFMQFEKMAWVIDKFGVVWQPVLAKK